MRMNTKQNVQQNQTHEGAPAYSNLTPLQQLRRSLLSCFLWEKEFYEDGKSIADRIAESARLVEPRQVAALAIEARTKFNLRHAPLMLLCVLAETAGKNSILADAIPQVVKRADEMGELVAMYWRKGKRPLSAQMKRGLAAAFANFDEYQLAKYNRDSTVKLRDVMFLVHPKPGDEARTALYKKIADNQLGSADTWEVALSAGADKKETFTRLIDEKNLGYLALLRNLRNMHQAGVPKSTVHNALRTANGFGKVLPFRFVAAARAVPEWEDIIDEALLRKIEGVRKLPGTTIVLVDVSGSMDEKLSSRSDMKRIDAACALAAIVQGETLHLVSFSNQVVKVPARRGMTGVDAVQNSQHHGGTELGMAMQAMNQIEYDRIIVITDEQSHTRVPGPKGKGYMINVASNKNGVGYGPWVHIDGFSERVLDFIYEHEMGEAK